MNAPLRAVHSRKVSTKIEHEINRMDHTPLYGYTTLVTRGHISIAAFNQLAKEYPHPEAFEKSLVQAGISIQQIGEALSSHYGIEYFQFDPASHERPSEMLGSVKRSFFETSMWLPHSGSPAGKKVKVVCTDYQTAKSSHPNPTAIYNKVVWLVTTANEYKQYLEWLFTQEAQVSILPDDDSHIDEILSKLDVDEEDDILSGDVPGISEIEDNEVVKLVNKTILDAYRRGISDIHIEPIYRAGRKSTILVRFRLDGALVRYAEFPNRLRYAIVARIKVQANLDISERRLPQDGKIKMKAGTKEFELRVATCSTAGGKGGEDVVMRILASSKPLPLEKMGFSAQNLETLKTEVAKPYGLFFVCGPTGSGKTTTLHSVLGHLNNEDTKILTAEDPVEITQEGLRQVQTNPKAGLTFAMVMRSFLRQDPDIIMVGEMRDQETIKIGIEASLTGHLVLSTLHTNSAAESIIRLLDMGVDPFNFADALLGVLAQRLGRTLCKDCKEIKPATKEEIESLVHEYCYELKALPEFKQNYGEAAKKVFSHWAKEFGEDGKIMLAHPRKVGCKVCGGTGFKGRVGLHELLVGTDLVKAAIQKGARPAEIMTIAMGEGMRTLKQDGIEKVIQGMTTIGEIRKVCIK